MIGRIIDFSYRNPWLICLFAAVAAVLGWNAMRSTKLDAIPDLSDTQVIVYARWDRSPDILEDQVAYPIASALLGLPKVKDIRAFSDFGYSYIYIVFDEGTDIYWARSRTLEYLNSVTPRLPKGVNVELEKDVTSVGWIYQYALIDTTGKLSSEQLRSYQDWYLRYALQTVPGVAEVAPVGGFVRQYQVNVDPNRLLAYHIPIQAVSDAVGKSNNDVGGRLVEFTGREYMVRGRGYIRSLDDVGNTVLSTNPQTGTPVLVRDVATVTFGPDLRRGVADLDGKGEAVGGVVIMRYGENAEKVIARVKDKLREIQTSLPAGVKLVTTYDRSELIDRAVDNLRHTLIEELIIVSIVILIFLWHLRSAVVPIVIIPITVLLAFIPMQLSGMTANIMSLGGIAVAIGALVDATVVVVEQAHKKLEQWESEGRPGPAHGAVLAAVKQVSGPAFFALLVIAVAFLPVFALEGQEGRLFKPLAWTKNYSMAIAALLSITLAPAAMRLLFARMDGFRFRPRWLARIVNAVLIGSIHNEEKHPISRPLMRIYQPIVKLALDFKWITILLAIAAMAFTLPIYHRLGSEFMPPLDEGSLLYMPSTLPGISVAEAARVLQMQDKIIAGFPEVERVFGKAGRADTATDPAPYSMMETTILLKPQNQWPETPRWYKDHLPRWTWNFLRRIWPDHLSTEELIYGPGGLNEALRIPGVSNAWTMPIKARTDMLSTGIRTPIGIKVLGSNLNEIERIGGQIESALKNVPGTSSVFAERTGGGYFLDFDLKRDALARYGLTMDDAESVVMSAVGGDSVSTTVEGRERYSINVRYLRDYRSDIDSLERVLVATPSGAQIPLGQIANIRFRTGPGMIRDENGRLSGYVYVDVAGRDIGSYVADAKKIVAQKVSVPTGYELTWSGQYEFMQRVAARLKFVVPITLFIVFLLLYFNTGSAIKTLIILLAVPFSAIGAVWFLYLLHYNMSIAVWVGLIALLGVDAETAVFMLMYLDLAYHDALQHGGIRSWSELREAIVHGAVKRLRPKVMTVACMVFGLLPILWSDGTGADVMKRIAAPMLGGILTSFLMELVVYPPIFAIWKWNWEIKPAMRKNDLSNV
jgi:copper/silver efflux system protein